MHDLSDHDPYEAAASETVDLANRLADQDRSADLHDIADGLLAGAVHYWLYSRQPCGDPRCDECIPYSTARERTGELLTMIRELAESSEYYHSPNDTDVGRA